jgi:sugar phosphate isomerase/epimerase
MDIGLRIPGACGKNLSPGDFARWCKNDGFGSQDLGRPDEVRLAALREAGLTLGTVDLPGTGKLLSPDAAVRAEGVEEASRALHAIAGAGGNKAFCVFLPPSSVQSRKESFENWKQAFPDVVRTAEQVGVRIAMEGWPGPGPQYPALGITPETWRAMFEAVPSDAFGLNYDPSHLVRVGVDYLRALDEFAGRVVHVHGKDTALDAETQYRCGNLPPVWERPVGFSEGYWRYTIPGEGVCDWAAICVRLARTGFDGTLSIELEDFRYNGSVETEQRGLSRARAHLARFV